MKSNPHRHMDLAKAVSDKILNSLKADATALDNCDTKGALARAKALSFGGYFDEAIETLAQAAAMDPSSDEILARLAALQLARGQAEEALETATTLAARSPAFTFVESTSDEVISAYTLLGDALVRNGREGDAVMAYELARRQAPQDTTSAARLAVHHITKGQSAEALKEFAVFAGNPRHQKLAGLMQLGKVNVGLLPRFDLSAVVTDAIVGRPLLVEDGQTRTASAIDGDRSWCVDAERPARG